MAFFYLLSPQLTNASPAPHLFPKRANYFLNYQLTEDQARTLSQWDVVILDMETQVNSKELIRKMRELHPGIIILVYITPQEIRHDALTSTSVLRRRLAAGIPDAWYLTNSHGTRFSVWPGADLLNVTTRAPVVNGLRFEQYLSRFVATELLSTGLWDGVFYDNAFDSITERVGTDVDIDRDGAPDADADASWRAGMVEIYQATRSLVRTHPLIVANGTTRAYRDAVNGMMLENFIPVAWTPTMRTYSYDQAGGPAPRLNIINANTGNHGGQNNYQAMRFGLGSTLLDDGYYAFDFGDQNHGQTWWYDEYGVELGPPAGAAVGVFSEKNYAPGVWRRDFAQGIVVVNSSDQTKTVALPGDFEKIHGAQDPAANDGAIVSDLSLAPYDARLLLKPLETIVNTLYPNGAFVRFFHPDGTRARNGFFLFRDNLPGGVGVAQVDLTGMGERDTVVIDKNKVSATRADGQLLFQVFPYTANFAGPLVGAIRDLNSDGRPEVVIGPARANNLPVKIYNRDGAEIYPPWFPFGSLPRAMHLALVAGPQPKIVWTVIGAGVGQPPLVSIYNEKHQLVRQWLAFEASFRGGVSVAAGDVTGDGQEEIIVGAGPGKKPIVKIFSLLGKEIYPPFVAYQATGLPGAEVAAVDIEGDGVKEIAVFSR